MKQLIWLGCVLVVAAAGCSGAIAGDKKSEKEWLYVLQGRLMAANGDTLTLDAKPFVTAFTDAPDRITASFETGTFVDESWASDGAFTKKRPNAAIVANHVSRDKPAVIEIDTIKRDGLTLKVAYRLIDGSLPVPPTDMSLFIDDDLSVLPDDIRE